MEALCSNNAVQYILLMLWQIYPMVTPDKSYPCVIPSLVCCENCDLPLTNPKVMGCHSHGYGTLCGKDERILQM